MHELHRRIAQLEAEASACEAGAAILFELGNLRLSAGDNDGAISAYMRSLAGAPDPSLVYNNLGIAYQKAGRFMEAIGVFEDAIRINPLYPRPLVNLGKALREAGRPQEAIVRLRQALELKPDYPAALVNLGIALAVVNDIDAAQAILERAIQLAPELPEAHLGLIEARMQAGRIEESIGMCRRALAHWPGYAEAHLALGRLLLLGGTWESAWEHFEYRFARASQPIKLNVPAGAAKWDGVTPPRNLILVGEQGLGDQIQFARYAPLLAERNRSTTIMCEPRLVQLLSAAKLAGSVVPFDGTNLGRDTHWYPLMSLAHWHRTDMESVPYGGGYLVADPNLIDFWRVRMPKTGCRVGLVWAGNRMAEWGQLAGRSPPLAALQPLKAIPQVHFISLQRGDGQAIEEHPLGASLLRWPDLDSGPDAFVDAAAILKLVDLLITPDTGIAHLAGALGVETWLCLHDNPDARWRMSGDRSPWYSSVRIFRQSARGDWLGLYRRVADELFHRIQYCLNTQ
jgi:Flp pilus assembly protein TadD